MSSHQRAAGTATPNTASAGSGTPSRTRTRDALRRDGRVGEAERVHDPEAVPGAVAPPRAALRVDARAVVMGGERVRHPDPGAVVEHDDVALRERAQVGRVGHVGRGAGRGERLEDGPAQVQLRPVHGSERARRMRCAPYAAAIAATTPT